MPKEDDAPVSAKAAPKNTETEIREAAAALRDALAKGKAEGLYFAWPTNELALNDIVFSQGAVPQATIKVK